MFRFLDTYILVSCICIIQEVKDAVLSESLPGAPDIQAGYNVIMADGSTLFLEPVTGLALIAFIEANYPHN
jgi:hypothetical protein